jgi:hypothetical protein
MNLRAALSRPIPPIFAVLAAFFVAGCASYFESKQGSGKASTSGRPVGSFSRIELRGGPDLQISVGSSPSVVVCTDDNLQSVIETTVANDTLYIRAAQPYSSPYGCIVFVTAPSLVSLSACGTGFANVTGLAGDKFSLSVLGSSDITLAGNVTNADFQLKGRGSIIAPNLVAQNLTLTLQGSGHAIVNATGTLDVTVTGSGRVRYVGQPAQIQRKVTSSGSAEPQISPAP